MAGDCASSSSRKTVGLASLFARLLRRAVYRSAASTITLIPKQRSWMQPWQACGADDSIPQCAQGGTGFPDGRGFGKCVPEFAGHRMGCRFPLTVLAESASRNRVQGGMRFPDGAVGGNCVPFHAGILGWVFRGRGCCHANWGGICTVCKNETRNFKNGTVVFCPFGVAFKGMSRSTRVKRGPPCTFHTPTFAGCRKSRLLGRRRLLR